MSLWLRWTLCGLSLLIAALLNEVIRVDRTQAAYYPEQPSCSSKFNVNQTTSTAAITLTNNGYICGIILISATAQNVSVVQGTGSTCGTNLVGLVGGTTASVALAANGGFVGVSGVPWLRTTTTAQNICILQSGSGNVSGIITYADAL